MFNREIISLAEQVVAECRRRKVMVCTVESCTGGLVAGALSEVAGASHALERGFVTYTNGAKSELVGVPPDLIHHHGAVSEAVARAMAEGGLSHSAAAVAVAVTGIAGPDGGSATKPVGLVHFATAVRDGAVRHSQQIFAGDRTAVRQASVAMALGLLLAALRGD